MSDITVADRLVQVSLARASGPVARSASVVDLTLISVIWRTIHAAYGLSVWLLGLVQARQGSLDE